MRLSRLSRFASLLSAALLTGWLLTACTSTGEPAPDEPPVSGAEPATSPVLAISMRMPVAASAGAYFDGNLYENYIDIDAGDFRVYFFDADNRFIAEFSPMFVNAVDETDFREYEMTGRTIAALAERHDFKVMVLANWPAYPTELIAGQTTIDDVCNSASATFGALTSFANLEPGIAQPMPFYGISHFTGVNLQSERYVELPGPITLVRAMAKIEIEVDTDDDTTLSGAELVGYNLKGFCAPESAYSEADYGSALDWSAAYMRQVHLPGNANDSDAASRRLRFAKVADRTPSTREKWIAYAPEFRNTATDGSPLAENMRSRIAVTFTGRVTATQYIDFKYYSEPPAYVSGLHRGDHFDLKRNYCYSFTLKKDKERLNVEVDVMPYAVVELTPDYGLERDENTGYTVIRKYAPDVYYYDSNSDRYFDKNYKEMAHRVEQAANGLYIVRDRRNGKVRYTFDASTGLHYTDTERKTRLTSPDQLTFETAPGSALKILHTNDYGEAIYFWDSAKKRCIDDSGATVPLPCFGYQLLPTNKAYIVIDYTGVGNYRVVYHPASDRYYMLNDDNSMTEMQAFPPKS